MARWTGVHGPERPGGAGIPPTGHGEGLRWGVRRSFRTDFRARRLRYECVVSRQCSLEAAPVLRRVAVAEARFGLPDLPPPPADEGDLAAAAFLRYPQACQHPRRQALLLPQEAKEQLLAADVDGIHRLAFFAGEVEGAPGSGAQSGDAAATRWARGHLLLHRAAERVERDAAAHEDAGAEIVFAQHGEEQVLRLDFGHAGQPGFLFRP